MKKLIASVLTMQRYDDSLTPANLFSESAGIFSEYKK